MKRSFWIVLLGGIFLSFFPRCVHSPEPTIKVTEAETTVFFLGNRQGEVDPCGCQVNQLGGIDRLANYFERESRGDALIVDAGDTFFSRIPISATRKDFERRRALLIAEVYRQFSVDVITPGERDFAEGVNFFKSLAVKANTSVVASNLTDDSGAFLFETEKVVVKGGVSIGIVGVSSPEIMNTVGGIKVTPALEAVIQSVGRLRKQGAQRIVVLSHLGLAADRELAKDPRISGVELVVGAHSLDALSVPERIAGIQIGQTMPEGQQVAKVILGKNASYELIDLDKNFAKPNAVSALIKQFKEQTRTLAASSDQETRYQATLTRPYVAHPFECRQCHAKQYEFWSKTKHASAYLTLFAKNQHFDPECISCHSLGFEQPGGFGKISEPVKLRDQKPRAKGEEPFIETFMKEVFLNDKVEALDSRTQPARFSKLQSSYLSLQKKLETEKKVARWHIGVQCEHCHGNRNGHPAGGAETLKKVNTLSCKNCHTPPNAAEFKSSMVKLVACPKR